MKAGFVIGDRALGSAGDTHPAWMLGYALAGPYLVAGTSAIGQIHLAQERPRDDAFVVRSLGPWVAVCVSDGLGSRPYSRYGATFTVDILTGALLRPFASFAKGAVAQATNPSPAPARALAPPTTLEELKAPAQPDSLLGGLVAGVKSFFNMDDLPSPASQKATRYLQQEGITSQAQLLESLLLRPAQLGPDAPLDPLQQIGSVGWRLVQPARLPPAQAAPTDPPAAAPPPDVTASAGEPSSETYDLSAIMRQAFDRTHQGLQSYARSLDLDITDLGCTALAMLLNVETGRFVVGQVGDGAIIGLTAQGKVKELLDADDAGDPQSVYTMTRPNYHKHLTINAQTLSPPFQAFYLMTDGLSGDLLYSPDQPAVEEWAQRVDANVRFSATPAQATAGMLHWLATYQITGSWDDRTLVVITRQENNNGSYQSRRG